MWLRQGSKGHDKTRKGLTREQSIGPVGQGSAGRHLYCESEKLANRARGRKVKPDPDLSICVQ